MAKIYVDTTRLVDFYRTVDDRIVQLDEVQKYKDSLVLTEQTTTEFRGMTRTYRSPATSRI